MSKIVQLSMFRESEKSKKAKDPWCSQLTLPNGRKIAGGPAREARIKAAGGMPAVLTDVFERATALASGRKTA